MITRKTLNAMLVSAVALAASGAAHAADMMGAGDYAKEKCYGVAKAGANDCASASKTHSCSGMSAIDASGDEWIAVPAGLCMKLAGGSLTPVAAAAPVAAPGGAVMMQQDPAAAPATPAPVTPATPVAPPAQ